MRRPLHLAACFAFACLASAAKSPTSGPASNPATTRAIYPLPANWHGHFVGTLSVLRPGHVLKHVATELTVGPPAGPNGSNPWTLAYEEPGQPKRVLTYILTPVPGHRDNFLLDDGDGGLFDQAMVDGALVSQFNVPGQVVYSRFERTATGVEVEIGTFQAAPHRTSGTLTLPVQSYPLVYLQRGTLTPAP